MIFIHEFNSIEQMTDVRKCLYHKLYTWRKKNSYLTASSEKSQNVLCSTCTPAGIAIHKLTIISFCEKVYFQTTYMSNTLLLDGIWVHNLIFNLLHITDVVEMLIYAAHKTEKIITSAGQVASCHLKLSIICFKQNGQTKTR